jgi:hypothetical protein
MRSRLPWLIAVPVMAAGSISAHSLSYVAVSVRTTEDAGEASERASNAGSNYLVLFIGMFAATAIVAASARMLLARRRGRRAGSVPPWLFFVLPPLAFALQELAERWLNAEAFPFHAALEPRLMIGLLLQLPFGVLALLVARALLRIVERIARAFAPRPAPRLATSASWRPKPVVDLRQIPALALGHAERGPPAL